MPLLWDKLGEINVVSCWLAWLNVLHMWFWWCGPIEWNTTCEYDRLNCCDLPPSFGMVCVSLIVEIMCVSVMSWICPFIFNWNIYINICIYIFRRLVCIEYLGRSKYLRELLCRVKEENLKVSLGSHLNFAQSLFPLRLATFLSLPLPQVCVCFSFLHCRPFSY